MTEQEARQRIDLMMTNAVRKLALMTVEEANDLVGRFFGEVLSGEEYECPGCGYPWPRDKDE